LIQINDDRGAALWSSQFIAAMPPGKGHIIEYLGEVGVCLQHRGILVGRRAHAHVWPEIISWLDGFG
jgi:polyhydroxyalkanoate synthase